MRVRPLFRGRDHGVFNKKGKNLVWLMAVPFIVLLVLAAVAPAVHASGVDVFGVDDNKDLFLVQ